MENLGNPWNTRMVHWTGNGTLQVIHLIYTKQKRGDTCRCGRIITTKSHHAQVVHNITIHQGSQGIDTDNKQPRTKTPLHYWGEPFALHL